jgi:hypothetical protein
VLLLLPETTWKWLVWSKGVRLEARKTVPLLLFAAAHFNHTLLRSEARN